MMEKYIPYLSYVIFDGTCCYAVPGMDVAEMLAEDPDCEVVAGPYDECDVDEVVDELNADIYGSRRY